MVYKDAGVTLRPDLMEVHEELQFPDLGLVADKILPPLNVSDIAGRYFVLPRENVGKVPDTKRAPNGTYSRGQWTWGENTYTCEHFGHEEDCDLLQAQEHAKYIQEEEISSSLAVQGLLLGREYRVANAFFNTTTFTGASNTGALSIQWDNPTTAVPVTDINTIFKTYLRPKNGFPLKRYSLILSDDLVDLALLCDSITDQFQYTTPIVTLPIESKRNILTTMLGVKEIIPISSFYDCAGIKKDFTYAKAYSNEYAMLAILSSGIQSMKEACIGRQTVWTPFAQNTLIEEYAEPARRCKVFRAMEYRGIKINTDYGFLITNMKTTVSATTGV
jgi:hypothetical protein